MGKKLSHGADHRMGKRQWGAKLKFTVKNTKGPGTLLSKFLDIRGPRETRAAAQGEQLLDPGGGCPRARQRSGGDDARALNDRAVLAAFLSDQQQSDNP